MFRLNIFIKPSIEKQQMLSKMFINIPKPSISYIHTNTNKYNKWNVTSCSYKKNYNYLNNQIIKTPNIKFSYNYIPFKNIRNTNTIIRRNFSSNKNKNKNNNDNDKNSDEKPSFIITLGKFFMTRCILICIVTLVFECGMIYGASGFILSGVFLSTVYAACYEHFNR